MEYMKNMKVMTLQKIHVSQYSNTLNVNAEDKATIKF